MEDVLIYAIIFAGLLGAGALLRRSAQSILDTPPPWAEPLTPAAVAEAFDVPVPLVDPAHVDDLGDLPRARRRPFDGCWPGTDVPKAGL